MLRTNTNITRRKNLYVPYVGNYQVSYEVSSFWCETDARCTMYHSIQVVLLVLLRLSYLRARHTDPILIKNESPNQYSRQRWFARVGLPFWPRVYSVLDPAVFAQGTICPEMWSLFYFFVLLIILPLCTAAISNTRTSRSVYSQPERYGFIPLRRLFRCCLATWELAGELYPHQIMPYFFFPRHPLPC